MLTKSFVSQMQMDECHTRMINAHTSVNQISNRSPNMNDQSPGKSSQMNGRMEADGDQSAMEKQVSNAGA